MTARSELLLAAQYLTAQGRAPFSPRELIAEVRSRGSSYPDSTLRTHILGPMCVNSPDHHGVQYGDLRRVGRGQYVLTAERSADESIARDQASAVRDGVDGKPAETDPATHSDAEQHWTWEGNVQRIVADHLEAEGWTVVRTADTASREAGADILARRDGRDLIVEVKGFPDRNKASANTKARHYAGGALLTALLAWSDHPHAQVVLAFPEARTYRNLARRLRVALDQMRISWWFVHEDGRVERWLDHTVG